MIKVKNKLRYCIGYENCSTEDLVLFFKSKWKIESII